MKAACNPCTVYVGERSQLTAEAQDPDGEGATLTYQWTVPAGKLESADHAEADVDRAP